MALSKKCKHPRRTWSRCGCAWYWNGYVDGHRTFLNVGRDRAAAREKAAELDLAHIRGTTAHRMPKTAAVEELADRWIDYLLDRGRRPQTIRASRTAANAVVNYFGQGYDVRLINSDAVEEFEAEAFRQRTGHGPKALMRALRGVLKQAHRDRLIDAIPSSPDPRQVTESAEVKMSEAETARTIACLSPPIWVDVADFIVLTGLRISEALALRWEDFDERGGVLSVEHSAEQRGRLDAPTKTDGSRRAMRLEAAVIDILKKQPKTDERIFPRRYHAAWEAMNTALKDAGTYKRRRGWHSLRHTNTALRDKAGQGIRSAAAELGHGANFITTHGYGWASEAAEPAPVSKVRQPRPPESET